MPEDRTQEGYGWGMHVSRLLQLYNAQHGMIEFSRCGVVGGVTDFLLRPGSTLWLQGESFVSASAPSSTPRTIPTRNRISCTEMHIARESAETQINAHCR